MGLWPLANSSSRSKLVPQPGALQDCCTRGKLRVQDDFLDELM